MQLGGSVGALDDLSACVMQLNRIQEDETDRLQAAERAEIERQQLIGHIYKAYSALDTRYNELLADFEGQKIANRHYLSNTMVLQREIDELRRSQLEVSLGSFLFVSFGSIGMG